MTYFHIWMKRNFLISLLIVGLFSWAIFASVFALQNNTLLIEVGKNGSRVIDGTSEVIQKAEAVRFVKLYLKRSYNFNKRTFKDNLGEMSAMMSLNLWQKHHGKILALIGHVESSELNQSGIIERITRPSPTSYEALVSVKKQTRAKVFKYQVKVILKLAQVKRSQLNPWGLEVIEDIDEKI